MENSSKNFNYLEKLKILKNFNSCSKNLILFIKNKMKENNITVRNFHNKALVANADFEKFFSLIESQDFTNHYLITNIPYGIQSQNCQKIYEKFDSFLEKYHEKFKKIFILNINSNK